MASILSSLSSASESIVRLIGEELGLSKKSAQLDFGNCNRVRFAFQKGILK
jgi:hypothetical protein